MQNDERISALNQLLDTAKNIVITFHVNPDGDALGSSLGLYNFLLKFGFEVTPISPNPFPDNLRWLKGSEQILFYDTQKEAVEEKIEKADIIFFMDFNEMKRLDALAKPVKASAAKKIMIDHHPYPEAFADITFSSTKVSSASELTYEIIEAIDNEKICKDVAECLFTGIMTDTGTFHFNSSRPRTYEIVGNLLKTEINKDQIYSNVNDNYSEERFRLLGYCLNEGMTVLPHFHTAYIVIRLNDKEKFNYQIGDSEGFVNIPLSIKGIVFSVIIVEQEDVTKMSFRSKGNFAVNCIARTFFNGGGHTNAAGGHSHQSVDKTIAEFVALLPQYLSDLQKTAKEISS